MTSKDYLKNLLGNGNEKEVSLSQIKEALEAGGHVPVGIQPMVSNLFYLMALQNSGVQVSGAIQEQKQELITYFSQTGEELDQPATGRKFHYFDTNKSGDDQEPSDDKELPIISDTEKAGIRAAAEQRVDNIYNALAERVRELFPQRDKASGRGGW